MASYSIGQVVLGDAWGKFRTGAYHLFSKEYQKRAGLRWRQRGLRVANVHPGAAQAQ
ncbi:hypothetical protein YC2023_034707 [Brassica napus]